MNNETVHHRDSYDEEYDEEYDEDEEVAKGNRRGQPDESMLMGMGLIGVVATQHIREEYDDEDEDEEENDYGPEQAPTNEGGGNENNYD